VARAQPRPLADYAEAPHCRLDDRQFREFSSLRAPIAAAMARVAFVRNQQGSRRRSLGKSWSEAGIGLLEVQ
jgi:hypothetical protein